VVLCAISVPLWLISLSNFTTEARRFHRVTQRKSFFRQTPKGCQTSGQCKFTAKDLAPLRGATQLISRIPGGLRGLRPTGYSLCNPSGLLRSVNYIVTLAKPRLGLNSDRCSAARIRVTSNIEWAASGSVRRYPVSVALWPPDEPLLLRCVKYMNTANFRAPKVGCPGD